MTKKGNSFPENSEQKNRFFIINKRKQWKQTYNKQ